MLILFSDSVRLIKIPLLIALCLTPFRFYLEYLGIPEQYIFLFGLLWLSLALSVYWGIKMSDQSNPYAAILVALLIFCPISRVPVAIAWWLDTTYQLGTHYGWYFDSFLQALLNQIKSFSKKMQGMTTLMMMRPV